MQQGQLSGGEDLIDEGIPILPIRTLVTLVVEFNTQYRLHRSRVAEQKIDVLAVNLVCVNAKAALVVRRFDPEDIRERDFAVEHGATGDSGSEHPVERLYA
jgi:hypothetical protein